MSAPQLYLLTSDEHLSLLIPKLRRALDTGAVDLVQIRRKHILNSQNLSQAYQDTEVILSACQPYDAKIVINDNLELALHFGVGVHLGQADGSVRTARQALGGDALIGSTCHGQLPLVLAAKEAGADYAAMGTMFRSLTKPNAKIAPNETLRQASRLGIDLCVIGGITLENAPTLQRMLDGVHIRYVAITADIMGQSVDDIAQHCIKWRKLLDAWYQ